MSANTDTAHAHIALMQAAFAALNRHDLDACVEMLTPDFIINLAGMPDAMHGADAWRQNVEMMLQAFSDLQIHVEDIFAADDKVAVRARLTGTHTGVFLGQAPTGKPIDYVSNELYRTADGRIAEEWICSDMLTLMRQIEAS